ncbi:MAG: substrate-binding domain-containing protein [Phycisphaerae bacterium]
MGKTETLRHSPSKFHYQHAMDVVEESIRNGQYRSGDRLPSLRELSKEVGTGFRTVHRALKGLAEKGILEIRHGSGTFVSDCPNFHDKKTIRIGLLYGISALEGDTPHPGVGAFMIGANQRCKSPDYLVQPIFYDFPLVETVGPTLLREGISGCAIMGGQLEEPDFAFLRDHRIHAVRYSPQPHHDGWTVTLSNDEHPAMTLLVEHLRSLGHQRIGFIDYAIGDHGAHRHFCQLAYDHQLGDPNELLVPVTSTSHITHWEDVEKFFSIQPLPTAVMVWDEFLIDIILNGCHRRGIHVPGDLSLVSVYDARPLGHRIPVTSTLTDASLSRTAYMACDLLVRHISGQPIQQDFVKFPPRLTAKASSGLAGVKNL